MKDVNYNHFSKDIIIFQDRRLPERDGWLAGYAALMRAHHLRTPLPEKLSFISAQHKRYETESWEVYTLRHKPEDTLQGHLEFALKYEAVDLAILHALFQAIDPSQIENWVQSEPTGRYSRRAWFFYEWLLGKPLSLPDVKRGNFVEALDPELQYTTTPKLIKRQRIRDNIPGTPDFCPLIRRTKTLDTYINYQLGPRAHQEIGRMHPDVLARASAFLLLKDSRASFEIEGEHPTKGRAERWGKAIGQAGLYPLTTAELVRLQAIVIEDHRFVKLGLRTEGGFIGVHERSTLTPMPDHISARWQDVPRLLEGMMTTYQHLHHNQHLDPVLVATLVAFGFVFIHPFADGNGRLHRYLIHHVLADLNFAPKGIVFPVSSVILSRLDEYRRVLESYSRPRLELIDWKPTKSGNLDVLNDTLNLYRYFDATLMAEFLYSCVLETIDKILPQEVLYLERYDQLKRAINETLDMPDPMIDLLIHFLQQNNGKLSKRAQLQEFAALSKEEQTLLEGLYAEIFLTPQKDL